MDNSGELPGNFSFRPIDFDQQCYEGRKNLYLPQFYKENHDYVELVLSSLRPEEVLALQLKERSRIKSQVKDNIVRLLDLLHCMAKDELSEQYKVTLLRRELGEHFGTTNFDQSISMGELVKCQLLHLLGEDIFNGPDN